ncbi:hypothetical protein BDK51DRAFT_37050 [Blyttiomyces helicus]|uniref:Uncharacterized protein n=1 Tax=Blyttiomyces helicus TaxID=388810 RepID=A0A4P9WB19_9FUNG|nr:hypothetical protein BDK51DRAFT_37050 [Blyttiomyces helicus]|eukprot:RKO87456.1 hypothetical protein BDK51DRAFT_37050 [Blyttiomyces helicus]
MLLRHFSRTTPRLPPPPPLPRLPPSPRFTSHWTRNTRMSAASDPGSDGGGGGGGNSGTNSGGGFQTFAAAATGNNQFDTYRLVQRLEAAGFSREVSEGIMSSLSEVVKER